MQRSSKKANATNGTGGVLVMFSTFSCDNSYKSLMSDEMITLCKCICQQCNSLLANAKIEAVKIEETEKKKKIKVEKYH